MLRLRLCWVVKRLRARRPSVCLCAMRLVYIIRLGVSERGARNEVDQQTKRQEARRLLICRRGAVALVLLGMLSTLGDSLPIRLCILFLIFCLFKLFCVCVRVSVSGVYAQRCHLALRCMRRISVLSSFSYLSSLLTSPIFIYFPELIFTWRATIHIPSPRPTPNNSVCVSVGWSAGG